MSEGKGNFFVPMLDLVAVKKAFSRSCFQRFFVKQNLNPLSPAYGCHFWEI